MVTLVGEPRIIGGNTAQLTSQGKVRITDAKGKTKDISAKSFQKQLLKNADKIENGDNFEFKSNSTAKKVAAGIGIAGAVAGLAAAIIYRKDITKYAKDLGKTIKETNWKKAFTDLGDKWKNVAKPAIKENYNKIATPVKESLNAAKDWTLNIFKAAGEILKKPYETLKNYRKK